MKDQKINRIMSASVVIAVLLLCILLSFMVYQMIAISERSKRISELEKQINALKEEQKQTLDDIDVWLSDWKIEEKARERGWYYGNDKR